MQLWDDNPTMVDLLGFTPIVDTVVAALNAPALDPVTIGVQSPWGGGKSTVLRILEGKLRQQPGTTVVRLDPWEFDDQFDVRGTVIAEVLQHLLSTYGKEHEDLDTKVTTLLDRIGSSRVAASLSQGKLVAQSKELIEALTPKSKKDTKSLAGFREAFAELIDSIVGLKRLVVLVDDLDRCLPDAVMASLEAIKLFLSVKKVAFVLAADQEMVRESIAASLDATGRGERFATRYLEKIVQVPLSLPRVGTDEAATYITLLLSAGLCPEPANYEALVQHAQRRRALGLSPVLSDLTGLPWAPDPDTIGLASRLASGMAAHRAGSPRSIKRFLNAFSLRSKIAEGQGITIEPAVIAKLMLLEDSHAKDFEVLASLPDSSRGALLEHWQAWGRGEREDKPEGISDASKLWAASEPDLARAPFGPYLTLAASLISLEVAATLTQEQLTWVMDLASEADLDRRQTQELIVTRPVTEQRAVTEGLVQRARRETKVDPLVESLVYLARHTEELRTEIAEGLWHVRDMLTPAGIYDMSQSDVPELIAVVAKLADATDIDAMLQQAAVEARDRG
ncbi:KAP family P-loop NTPase fold protein [Kitasatospora cineracea]|nr:P-loop NTPase fold protein [Kitasatospora cineracea]